MIAKLSRESVEKSIGGWLWRRSWGVGPSGLDKLDWSRQARPAKAGWASAYAVSTSSTGLDELDPLARSGPAYAAGRARPAYAGWPSSISKGGLDQRTDDTRYSGASTPVDRSTMSAPPSATR